MNSSFIVQHSSFINLVNKKVITEKIATLTGHNSSIFSIISYKSPNLFLSGAGDGWIVVWDFNDPEMGRLVAKVETQIFSLCYLADANKVIAGNMNGGVHWVDLANPTDTRNILHHQKGVFAIQQIRDSVFTCLLYTSPSPRDRTRSRMPSSA